MRVSRAAVYDFADHHRVVRTKRHPPIIPKSSGRDYWMTSPLGCSVRFMNVSSGPQAPASSSTGPAAAQRSSLTDAQIGDWIRAGAHDALRGYPPVDEKQSSGAKSASLGVAPEILRRIKESRHSLERAEAKNAVKIIKPLRSLRRDQSAVNESLIDSIRSLLAVNREMLNALETLSVKFEDLQTQLAEQRMKGWPPAAGRERE